MPHHPVKLHISHNQVLKIKRGEPIQIKHEHIGHHQGATFTNLHPSNLDKLHRAHRARKGVRLHLTHHELEGTGLLDWLKKAGSWVSKHSGVLKPIASAALDAGSYFFPEAMPARAFIKKTTGVGIHPSHAGIAGFSHGMDPMMHHESHFKTVTHHKKKAKKSKGRGIIPAGYSGF